MFQLAILQFHNWVKLVCNLHQLLEFWCSLTTLSSFLLRQFISGLDHQGFGTLGIVIWQANPTRLTTFQQFCKLKYCPLLLCVSVNIRPAVHLQGTPWGSFVSPLVLSEWQFFFISTYQNLRYDISLGLIAFLWERSLMTSLNRVCRGSKIAPQKGRYRVEQGRRVGRLSVDWSEMAKKRGTSLNPSISF